MIINNPSFEPQRIDFGYSGNLPTGSGEYFEITNNGYATIGLNIRPPNNGLIQFQGSFDGEHFSQVTFRQVGNDGYTHFSDIQEDYIGSISSLKKIRFVNYSGSPLIGTVKGNLTKQVSTLEGLEHSAPPHKFGNILFHAGINISGTATDYLIYTPEIRRKFALTYLSFGASAGAGAYITFHEGSGTSDNAAKWIFTTYLKNNVNDTQFINSVLTTPYVSKDFASGLFLTTSSDVILRGVIHGYDTED